jgi:hypothetical protein
MVCKFEQLRFIRAIGNAGQCAHLGKAELAAGKRRACRRQAFQRVRDADLFSRRVEADAAAPVEPVRTG